MVTGSMEDLPVEQALITGVAHDRSEAKITVVGVPDEPGEAARIFEAVAGAEINIDMIVQNVSPTATGRTDISFTLPQTDGPTAMAALARCRTRSGSSDLLYDDHVGKVSLIGAGMRSHPGVAAKFFGALAEAGVNIEMISTSEIRVSVVCRDTDLDAAVRAVHEAFELGGDGRSRRLRRDREVTGVPAHLPTLAVVGATGAVGNVMCELLSSRRTYWGEIRLIASPRSAGRDGCGCAARSRPSPALTPEVFDGVDVAMFDVPDEVSARVGAGRGRPRRGGGGQLRRVPDGPGRAAGGARDQPGAGRATGPRGSSPTPTAPRCR